MRGRLVYYVPCVTSRNKFYTELRSKIGTRREVAKLLGVCYKTVERRELGHTEITEEMIAALEFWIHEGKK
jgi:hypothetical protein